MFAKVDQLLSLVIGRNPAKWDSRFLFASRCRQPSGTLYAKAHIPHATLSRSSRLSKCVLFSGISKRLIWRADNLFSKVFIKISTHHQVAKTSLMGRDCTKVYRSCKNVSLSSAQDAGLQWLRSTCRAVRAVC